MWEVGSLGFLPMTFIGFRLDLWFHVSSAENQLLSSDQPDKALWPVPTEVGAAAFFKTAALLLNLPFCCSTVALNFARVFMLMSTEDMVFEDGSGDLNSDIILVGSEICRGY